MDYPLKSVPTPHKSGSDTRRGVIGAIKGAVSKTAMGIFIVVPYNI